MGNGNGKNKESFDDLQSYPFMTTGLQGWLAQTGEIGGVRASPGRQIVASALRDLLGVTASVRDPQGFANALRQAVSFEKTEGRRIAKWARPGYSVKINQQGATGAQASLLAHTYTALEKATPLIDALKPLSCCPDALEVGEIREIIHEKLQMLGDDLGSLGGPHARRVDSLFDQLLGEDFDPEADPEEVGGLVGEMRRRLGMARTNVNTDDDEKRLTDYVIAHSQLSSIWQSWQAQREAFDPNSGKEYLGTQLVTLGRHLADLGDLVQRSILVLDSVFIGPAVRENAIFELNGDRFTLAELLTWIERVSRVKVRSKDAANSVRVELETLHELMEEVAGICQAGGGKFAIQALCTPRVQRVLDEMVISLDKAAQAAGRIKLLPPPEPSTLMPDEGDQGEAVPVILFGERFVEGACLELGDDIEVQSCKRLSANVVKALLLIHEDATPGLRDVIVRNPDGQADVLKDGFEVIESEGGEQPPEPEIDGVEPGEGGPDEELLITIHGSGFSEDADLDMGADIDIVEQENHEDHIIACIQIADTAASGWRDVKVTNPEDGAEDVLVNGFCITPCEAVGDFCIDAIEVIDPPSDVDPSMQIQVTGEGFDRLKNVAVVETDTAEVTDIDPVNDHTFQASLDIDPDSLVDQMVLTLEITSKLDEADQAAFTVTVEEEAPPAEGVAIDHIDPAFGEPGSTLDIDIFGKGFVDDSTFKVFFGRIIKVLDKKVMDSDHIWARIKIGETPPGHVEAIPRDVKVTVKGVEKTLPGGFEIRPQRTSGEEEK